MSVDYNANGGIGIYVNEEFISKIVSSGKATEGILADCLEDTLEQLAKKAKLVKVKSFGNAYRDTALGQI